MARDRPGQEARPPLRHDQARVRVEVEEPVGLALSDHIVVNDDLDDTIEEMLQIIDSARAR